MIQGSVLTVAEHEINDIEELEKLLTIPNPEYVQKVRFSKSSYGLPSKTLSFLRKQPEKTPGRFSNKLSYSLPRNISKDYFSIYDIIDSKADGLPVQSDFTNSIDLWDYQVDFFKLFDLSVDEDLIFEVPCGHGKTLMALYVMGLRRKRTLVLVPTNYLRDQWELEVVQHLPKATLYVADPSHKDLITRSLKADIMICTLDLFTSRSFTQEFFDSWGQVVMDEAHKVGAESYHSLITKIPARYRLALSATFRRADGMHRILECHFGKRITMQNQFPPANLYPVETGFRWDLLASLSKLKAAEYEAVVEWFESSGLEYELHDKVINMTPEEFEKFEDMLKVLKGPNLRRLLLPIRRMLENYLSDPFFPVIDSYVAGASYRMKIIVSLINTALASGRTVLVLSKRKTQLKRLYKIFKDVVPTALVISGETTTMEARLFAKNEARLVLGIDRLAQEGMNIPRLDTLIPVHPFKDPEQAIGRIMRTLPGKKKSVVLWPLDDNSVYRGVYYAAQKYIRVNAVVRQTLKLNEVKTVVC